MKLVLYLRLPFFSFFLYFLTPYFPALSTSLTEFEQAPIEVLFAPDDKPTQRLLLEIEKANFRIYAAVYMLTDIAIAKALTNAKNRGVDVQIVTDQASANSPFGKIHFLNKHDIKVYVFNGKKTEKPLEKNSCEKPPQALTEAELQLPFKKIKYHHHHKKLKDNSLYKMNYTGLMHEKFVIIDYLLWLGSFNWTISANRINQENVLILKNKITLEKFLQRFKLLKSRCSEVYTCHEKQKSLQGRSIIVNKNHINRL